MQLPPTLICWAEGSSWTPCRDPQPWGTLVRGCPWVLWEFPLLLKVFWQFVDLHHTANVAPLSTVVTAAHLSLNLQKEALSAVNALLYHTQSRSDPSFLQELYKRGRHHRGMEVQLLEEMKNAFYFGGLNFSCTLSPLFSSWLQKSES